MTKRDGSLEQGDERLRLIVENALSHAIYVIDPNGVVTDWSNGAAAVFGFSREEIEGRDGDILFTPEDRDKGEPEKERHIAEATGKADDIRWHMRKDGARIFIEGVSTALRDSQGRLTGFLKIGQDVTERRSGEERQRLLLWELQHRVRNILAMIRAVARRTSVTADSVEDYAQHLEGRIDAMARTQAILTRNPGQGADLQEIVEAELLSAAAQASRYRLEGPEVALEPRTAEVLTLAVHELATNAIKYGTLALGRGELSVNWEIEERAGEPWLSFSWRETGVPDVSQPGREGFGTELITRRIPYELGGTGTLQACTDGVLARIEFPLRRRASILETGPSSLVEAS
jgi:PAS domain S-box-containing protein